MVGAGVLVGGMSISFCQTSTFDLWNIPDNICAATIFPKIRPRTPQHHVWPGGKLFLGEVGKNRLVGAHRVAQFNL